MSVLANKTDIIAMIERFCYSKEVRVLNDPPYRSGNIPTLTLLVKCTSKTPSSWEAPGWLGTKLAEILNCEVKITVAENVKPLYKNYVIENSAPIEDKGALCRLFGVASTSSVVLEEIDMKFHRSLLKQANQYLGSLATGEKKISEAENLNHHSGVCESETDTKKRKVDSSGESNSPNQASTESPQKIKSPGSLRK